jgi:prepilin-type N-terminal cleavage/methylation domain-containing protein
MISIKYNNLKPSFTLFEVLVSLVILSITIGGVTKLFKTSSDIGVYYELIKAQNNFTEFDNISETQNIKFNKTIK